MRTAAVTGAYGYLGSRIRSKLDESGWKTVGLVRTPRPGDEAVAWRLGERPSPDVLRDVDAVIHCAYDFAPRRGAEIWRVNVEGTRLLLETARHANVERILVLSSMSAYEGTSQLYGQAKLAIERLTLEVGGIGVRPGLVYGDRSGGMAGALLRLTRLPLVPVIGATAYQYPVHEGDLTAALVRVLEAPSWQSEVFGIAQPRVRFGLFLAELARREGRELRHFSVPWRPVYWVLRAAEALGLRTYLRADSVLGLVRPAQCVPGSTAFPNISDRLRVIGMPGQDDTEGTR